MPPEIRQRKEQRVRKAAGTFGAVMAKKKSVLADPFIRRLGAAMLASIALALSLVAFKTLRGGYAP